MKTGRMRLERMYQGKKNRGIGVGLRIVGLVTLLSFLILCYPQKALAVAMTPQILTLVQSDCTDTTITVAFSAQYADSVEVWLQDNSKPASERKFNRIGTTTSTSYRISGLNSGNTYDIQIVAINGENRKLTATKTLYGARTKLGSVNRAYQILWDQEKGTVTVGWDKMPAADGYEYLFENEAETVVLDKGSVANNVADFEQTFNVSNGQIYKFSVKAFQNVSGKKIESEWRSIWCMPQAQIKSVVKANGKLTIKWKKVKGATGYDIYVSSKPKTGYKKVKSVSSKTKSLTVKKVGGTKIKKKKVWYVSIVTKRGDSGSDAARYYSSASGGKVPYTFQK